MKKQQPEPQQPVKGTDPEMINILKGTVEVRTVALNRAKEYVRDAEIKLEDAQKRLENYEKYGDPDYEET